jgi:hypothetical protein
LTFFNISDLPLFILLRKFIFELLKTKPYMIKTITTAIVLFFFVQFSKAQIPYIVDNCFSSVAPQTTFPSGFDLANLNADLMEFNGFEWIGAHTNAQISIKPPSGRVGCKAVFIGHGIFWTYPGEAFAIRLGNPLVAGNTYTFTFTYVSHGWGCDGAFSPKLFSNDAPLFGTEEYIMDLPAVGFTWENHTISFTATTTQDGDNWLFLETDPTVSSGMISAFCEGCATIATSVNALTEFNPEVYPNPARNTLNVMLNSAGINHLRYEVCSSSGQVIITSEEDVTASIYNSAIDISSLPDGYYFIRIMSADKTSMKPFIRNGN